MKAVSLVLAATGAAALVIGAVLKIAGIGPLFGAAPVSFWRFSTGCAVLAIFALLYSKENA